MTPLTRFLAFVRDFLTGGAFPSFALSLLLCWEFFLIGMLLMPAGTSGLGAFAEDFRIWCYGYDPATGRTQWSYVMAMILPQVAIGTFVALFWWEPLRETLKSPRIIARNLGAAALLVACISVGFALSGSRPSTGELPFPAEALRTAFRAPEFELTNQTGESIDLAALRGNVVVLTAVYSSCAHTCPAILGHAKAAIGELPPGELGGMKLIAVTMDPENDSPEVLARLAKNHGLRSPLYNLVTGAPAEVERVLDRMEIARERDPETGVINHANLFLLIDREGRVAYRLGLGERQQRWLVSALKVLLKEPGESG
jgi:protein SCO1/2